MAKESKTTIDGLEFKPDDGSGNTDKTMADQDKPVEPVEVTVDPATLPHVEERNEDGSPKEKESHLYQPATLYFSEGSYAEGAIESEFDDGTVDVMTALGRWSRVPLKLDGDEGAWLATVYPRVELGSHK